MAATASPRVVRLGNQDVTYPGFIQPAEDSTPLLKSGDLSGLRQRLADDGFLVFKQLIDRDAVLAARQHVLADFAARGGILDGSPQDGLLNPRCELGCIPFMEGRNSMTHCDTLLRVLEAPELRDMVQQLLDVPSVLTLDYKWLRGVPRKGYTGAHVDNVYMSRGSPRLHTTWIPLDDCTLELGALAMCKGSNRLPGFSKLQGTYGSMDTERDGLQGTGWFTNDPREISDLDRAAQWVSCDYRAGDVVCFTMRTVHMSTANLTDRVRLSADVRWQPAGDVVDRRYVGTAEEVDPANRVKSGAWSGKEKETGTGGGAAAAAGETSATTTASPPAGPSVTLRELREKWGFPLPEGSDAA